MFSKVSVSHSVHRGRWVPLVPCPFWGVSLVPGPFGWVGVSGTSSIPVGYVHWVVGMSRDMGWVYPGGGYQKSLV